MGFMNDSTYRNASDPNSLLDQGMTRNAVYNIRLTELPAVSDSTYSKVLPKKDKEKAVLNKTFYSCGAKYTNIRTHLK